MKKINAKTLLLIFIILMPVLDMVSFVYRNKIGTEMSITAILRPIIPIVLMGIIFFKNKFKGKLIISGLIYTVYAAVHIYVFNSLKTEISHGTTFNELQYVINYTFGVLILFLFIFVFYKESTEKLEKAILLQNAICIGSIYLSIITKTSSSTYIEGIGYKGLFESGNNISSILVLQVLIVLAILSITKSKTIKIIASIEIVLTGAYLTFLLGTRTGLYGFVLACAIFIFAKVFIMIRDSLINSQKNISPKRKALYAIAILCVIAGIAIVIINKDSILKRRQYLESIECDTFDDSTGEVSHISGDILKLKEQINDNSLNEEVLSGAAQRAILDVYEYANKHNLMNTDRRTQQLVYHIMLVKEQKNILAVVFGNGFLNHLGELSLEMEIPAFLFNFGVVRFSIVLWAFCSNLVLLCILGN